MNEINWKGVDLNLLLSFDALMNHGSVTRAADSLHLGQSAMSHNLARLRKLLEDPLFERQGHAMVPTRRARELAPKVASVLRTVREEILTPLEFDPSQSREPILIGLNDYAELVFGPGLFDQLRQEAPNAQLVFQAVDSGNCEQALLEGRVDLVLGSFGPMNHLIDRTQLYREKHVCLFDNQTLGLPLPLTLEDYLATPQAVVTATGELSSQVDQTLAALGVQREVVLGSARFLTLRHLLGGRRLLCVMAEMMGRAALFQAPLTLCEPPIPISDFDIELAYARMDREHPRMQWLLQRIEAIVSDVRREILQPPESPSG